MSNDKRPSHTQPVTKHAANARIPNSPTPSLHHQPQHPPKLLHPFRHNRHSHSPILRAFAKGGKESSRPDAAFLSLILREAEGPLCRPIYPNQPVLLSEAEGPASAFVVALAFLSVILRTAEDLLLAMLHSWFVIPAGILRSGHCPANQRRMPHPSRFCEGWERIISTRCAFPSSSFAQRRTCFFPCLWIPVCQKVGQSFSPGKIYLAFRLEFSSDSSFDSEATTRRHQYGLHYRCRHCDSQDFSRDWAHILAAIVSSQSNPTTNLFPRSLVAQRANF